MNEWRDIKGFEGQYQISNTLEVRRLPFTITQKDRRGNDYTRSFKGGILKKIIDSQGYYSVTLGDQPYRLHWLFYNTFIGDSTGYYIDHIDRNRLNNSASNLRLLTPKDSCYNRTLPYRPDIIDVSKWKKNSKRPFVLRFSEDGKRKYIGSYKTYDEAENKYRELYNKRQERIDDRSFS